MIQIVHAVNCPLSIVEPTCTNIYLIFLKSKSGKNKNKRGYEKSIDVSSMKNPVDAFHTAYTEIDVSIRTSRGSRRDADGTRVIWYNRIMRAAICGRKSGRIRGESTQCFVAGRGYAY